MDTNNIVYQHGHNIIRLLNDDKNSCKCIVLRQLYELSRLVIVYNNILYMYILLKSIYTRCFFQKILRGQHYPILLL